MSFDTDEVICTECKSRFRLAAKPKRSFLGFPKLFCPQCKQSFLYPLTSGYLFFYWLMVALMIVVGAYVISQGGTPIPGFVAIAIVFALFKNSSIKRKLE